MISEGSCDTEDQSNGSWKKSKYSFLIPLLEIFNDTNEDTLFRAYEKWCDELSTGSLQ